MISNMKTRTIVLSLLLALSVTPLSARQFTQGEKLYVNTDQSQRDGNGKFNWSDANANLFLYVWKIVNNQPTGETWLPLTVYNGNIYTTAMPTGDYQKCIVVRKNSSDSNGNWNNVWNQTGDIDFGTSGDLSCLYTFWQGGDGAQWRPLAPSVADVAAFANAERTAGKQEHIHICPSALGGPFSLRVKLKANKSDYDYENVVNHAWYMSTDGNTWSSVDGWAGIVRTDEGEKAIINNTLPGSGSEIYYYLHSAKAAGRRLIKLTPDAMGCDLDCSITSFQVACSEVNANDTTYTLDGMVAFGEPNGDLVITCEGQSTTISGAKSPQIFSIAGLRAATSGGKTTVATATFTGNATCQATATVNIPNATQGILVTHIDQWFGETKALNPSGANFANEHKWYINGVEQPEMQGAQTSIAYDEPNTTRYTYREFNPPAGDMTDMMRNGGYDTADVSVYGPKWQESLISDYEFWGKYETATQLNFYTDTIGSDCVNPNKRNSNGFAVVKDANKFFYTFAKVQAREGNYFALFDAASDGVKGKKAWYARTTNNPNLKLRQGTTYLFSFWAANINNYGEMDNAAKLQFQIEYNGKTQLLGEVLDLGSDEFRNNRWHQCSATFLADADATDVIISVVNLNTNTLNTGNDFALDDIQFRAVSSATRAVRIQQVFEVETHDPYTCVEKMYRKWDNVLFVDNHDSVYVAYQWYKNSKAISGDQGRQQRYYAGSGVSLTGTTDLYHCVMTRKDGTTEQTCPHTFDATPKSSEAAVEDIQLDGIAVYPTQVKGGGTVTISSATAGSVQATLLTLTGQTISRTLIEATHNTIEMPAEAGIYILQLQGLTSQRTIKIHVL